MDGVSSDGFSINAPKGELQKKKKGIAEKQNKQAVRQRKMQYIINKLTGSGEQDSLLQTAKDIVRMKTSFVMVKVVKFIGALLAPLFGILFILLLCNALFLLLQFLPELFVGNLLVRLLYFQFLFCFRILSFFSYAAKRTVGCCHDRKRFIGFLPAL